MLYITTRDKYNVHTAAYALATDRGEDMGFYLPFQMPEFSADDLEAWVEKSFSQCVADMLNLFFTCRLTSWDVEFAIGRYPVKLAELQQKICIAEAWHNQAMTYDSLEAVLTAKLNVGRTVSWVKIAIRIAVLVGVYATLRRKGILQADAKFDISLPVGSFSEIMAAWYVRQIGLPVGNIICACEENSSLWELLHNGQVKGSAKLPEELERLICATLGVDEVIRFCQAREIGTVYELLPEELEKLTDGLFASVVSERRMQAVIPNVYHTAGYVVDPKTALAYAGLSDYRAKAGANRVALLLAEESPLRKCNMVASTMGITEDALRRILGRM